jgi:hypothetical protein
MLLNTFFYWWKATQLSTPVNKEAVDAIQLSRKNDKQK